MRLYLTILEGKFIRCLASGHVNWGNTQWYTVEDLQVISQELCRPIHIIPFHGNVGGKGFNYERDVMSGDERYRWKKLN